jgi:hypothetical protein
MRAIVSTRFRMFIVLAALGAGSFSVSTVAEAARPTVKKTTKKGKAKGSAGTEDCKTDADCVLVADDCCSCQQGGKARAIPKKQKDAYEKDRKKRCADTACTEMMSTDPSCTAKPFCGAGICELGDSGSPPSAP